MHFGCNWYIHPEKKNPWHIVQGNKRRMKQNFAGGSHISSTAKQKLQTKTKHKAKRNSVRKSQ